MNITTRSAIVIAASILLGACSSAPSRHVYEVNASVINMQKAPELCTYKKKSSSGGKTLLGAVIGGVIGNQFGSGSGRALMTVVGAGAGAVIATDVNPRERSKMNCKSDGYIATVAYLHPLDRRMVTENVHLERSTRAKTLSIPVRL